MADSSTSSTSQRNSKKTQPFRFQAKIENQNIQLVAKLRNLHQHSIKLSIKNLQRKQSNNTQDYELGFTFLLRCCSRFYCYSCFFVTLFFYVVVLRFTVILVVLDLLRKWQQETKQKTLSVPHIS
ncbi:hypothetical protein AHAS_Ahas12G0221500 [Arachis hypogaea]